MSGSPSALARGPCPPPHGKIGKSMDSRSVRIQALYDALASRILVLDGAMGTMLQQRNPTIDDWGGPRFENCSENLLFTHPEWIAAIHRAYFEAGADIVETNSFGGHPVTLAEFGIEARCYEVNFTAARLARQVADEFSTPQRPRFVAGSMGPTTKAITVTVGVTFSQLRDGFYTQAKGLWEGGADILLIETAQDTRNIKAALLGVILPVGDGIFLFNPPQSVNRSGVK